MHAIQKAAAILGPGVAVLCVALFAVARPSAPPPRPGNPTPGNKPGPAVAAMDRTVRVPPDMLTPFARQVLDRMDAADQAAVAAFLTDTPGTLDNYLLKLAGLVNMANARYDAPDPADWKQALPVARVLEENMCDCAQRNWLNQFIALGEYARAGDVERYHAQGGTMAHIIRFNGDTVDKQAVTNRPTP